MALTGLLIGSALALAKNELLDKPAAERKRKYEAATAAYSPWTKMQSSYVQDPNALNQMIGIGGAGAAMGSMINYGNAQGDLARSLADNVDASESVPWSSKMSSDIGDRASKFSSEMNASIDAGAHPVMTGLNSQINDARPSWFFGQDPRPYSQPTFGSVLNSPLAYTPTFGNAWGFK